MPERMNVGETFIGPSASDHNDFVSAYRRVFGQNNLADRRTSAGHNRLTVLVKNTLGSNIDSAFPVLEIDGPVFTATDRPGVVREAVTLKGKTPTATAKMSDIVIVQSRMPALRIRPGVVQGITWCNVSVTNEAHTHVVPKVGDNTQLASASTGTVKIFWKEAGTGTKKALIILGGGGEPGGKLRAGFTNSLGISARSGITLGSGTVSWATTGTLPLLTLDGTSDTVYNIASSPVGGERWIIAAQNEQGTWLVIVEDCG